MGIDVYRGHGIQARCGTQQSQPYNNMLHFVKDRDGVIFIGLCDWGISTRL
jgi:hypothetical protein